VAGACLTIYDMLKYTGKGMTIDRIRLLEKTGGRSGEYRRRIRSHFHLQPEGYCPSTMLPEVEVWADFRRRWRRPCAAVPGR